MLCFLQALLPFSGEMGLELLVHAPLRDTHRHFREGEVCDKKVRWLDTPPELRARKFSTFVVHL